METTLSSYTRPGELYEKLDGQKVRCFSCGHRCLILNGKPGICQVRFNDNGVLRVPHGYVAALQLDPVEKKPFFHALPGAKALSFGMMGCDFHCAYCQNWDISQAIRDPEAGRGGVRPVTPESLCDLAQAQGARIITSTYNEPLITSEWAVTIFREAKRRGLVTSYVSNGNGTPEVLEYIRPWVDLYKVDLKASPTPTTGSSAATWRKSWTRSNACTTWASGWRSSR
jgi:pyruvate formate lyase activating enzyme